MCKMLKALFKTEDYNSGPTCSVKSKAAKVVDGKLVLSFPDAVTPVVWQMDLATAKSSALEIKNDKRKKQHILIAREGEDVTEIASFEEAEAAKSALMDVATALQTGSGNHCGHNHGSKKERSVHDEGGNTIIVKEKGRWWPVILSILVFVLLLFIWGAIMPNTPNGYNAGLDAPGADESSFSGSNNEAGVPLSADEFLMGR